MCVPPASPGHPTSDHTVRACLHVILNEEWEQQRSSAPGATSTSSTADEPPPNRPGEAPGEGNLPWPGRLPTFPATQSCLRRLPVVCGVRQSCSPARGNYIPRCLALNYRSGQFETWPNVSQVVNPLRRFDVVQGRLVDQGSAQNSSGRRQTSRLARARCRGLLVPKPPASVAQEADVGREHFRERRVSSNGWPTP